MQGDDEYLRCLNDFSVLEELVRVCAKFLFLLVGECKVCPFSVFGQIAT